MACVSNVRSSSWYCPTTSSLSLSRSSMPLSCTLSYRLPLNWNDRSNHLRLCRILCKVTAKSQRSRHSARRRAMHSWLRESTASCRTIPSFRSTLACCTESSATRTSFVSMSNIKRSKPTDWQPRVLTSHPFLLPSILHNSATRFSSCSLSTMLARVRQQTLHARVRSSSHADEAAALFCCVRRAAPAPGETLLVPMPHGHEPLSFVFPVCRTIAIVRCTHSCLPLTLLSLHSISPDWQVVD